MANLIRRRKSKKQRAVEATKTFVKARIAWLAGKKAAKIAAPAVIVGAAAAIAKKRSGGGSYPAATQ
jgi:hypothetical protein